MRRYLPVALIGVGLVALLSSSFFMVRFQEFPRNPAHPPLVVWRFDQFVREAGYARAALGVVGLLLLLFPFRKRELWAWFALCVMFSAYVVPVFVLPSLWPFPGWYIFWEWIFQPGLTRAVFSLAVLYPALMLLGLAVSLPRFLGRGASEERPDPR